MSEGRNLRVSENGIEEMRFLKLRPRLFSSVGLAKRQPRGAGCLGPLTPLRGLDRMDFLPINEGHVSKIAQAEVLKRH
jgi:hypothetical protein